MAKTHKLSSDWSVKNGVLSLRIDAREPDADKDAAPVASFERKVDLGAVFGEGYSSLSEVGKSAIEFGAFTALRNSTGSASDIGEAEAAMQRRIDAWESGEWGSERESSATPFSASHLLALAVEKASGGQMDAATAAEKLCAMAEQTCAANSLPEFSKLDASERGKIRKAVVDSIRESKPAIAAAYSILEADRQEAALKRKREAAAKAAEAAGDQGDTML